MFSHFKQNRKTLQWHFKFHTYWWLDLFDDHFFCIIQMCTTNFRLDHFFCIQIAPTFHWIIHPSSYHLQACLNRALSALITSSAALYNLQNTSHSLWSYMYLFWKGAFSRPTWGAVTQKSNYIKITFAHYYLAVLLFSIWVTFITWTSFHLRPIKTCDSQTSAL